VVISAVAFETGGAYSVAPTFPSATAIIGPDGTAAGTGCTLTQAMTGLIGTTALAVTGGTGTGATVDITLTENGADASERNTNDRTENGLTDEKEVTLKLDATGRTNKPYVHLITLTRTSGINTRYGILGLGSIAHNPALDVKNQVNLSPGLNTSDVMQADAPYLLCSEDQGSEMDFWFSVDDFRVFCQINNSPQVVNTDDGEYLHIYGGYYDSGHTESEDPYPYLIGASARTPNIDPAVSSTDITSLCELVAAAGGTPGCYFYRAEDSTWVVIENSNGPNPNQTRNTIMFPMGQVASISQPGSTSDAIAFDGPVVFWTAIGSTSRASPSRRLLPVPGSTPKHFPIPMIIDHRPGGINMNQTLDMTKGALRGVYWVYNTDDAAATITNFSEDIITIGSDRYFVFHSHVQRQLYHYICVKEDV
jgi:hypothetical protein